MEDNNTYNSINTQIQLEEKNKHKNNHDEYNNYTK